jgi:ankyrin repeat protein
MVHCAVSGNSLEYIKIFLSLKGIYTKTYNGDSVLHIAARNKNIDAFHWVIQYYSADINERNNSGETVLLSCLKFHHIDTNVLDLLLDHGADFNVTNADGDTALHVAARIGRLDFVTYFIHLGLDVNARNLSHNTSLHFAAKNGFLDEVELLVENGCDVTAVNNANKSALQLAANGDWRSVVDYLEQHLRTIDGTE